MAKTLTLPTRDDGWFSQLPESRSRHQLAQPACGWSEQLNGPGSLGHQLGAAVGKES